jgi:hypothetical protein
MADETQDPKVNDQSRGLPRRNFVTMSVAAAGLAASCPSEGEEDGLLVVTGGFVVSPGLRGAT